MAQLGANSGTHWRLSRACAAASSSWTLKLALFCSSSAWRRGVYAHQCSCGHLQYSLWIQYGYKKRCNIRRSWGHTPRPGKSPDPPLLAHYKHNLDNLKCPMRWNRYTTTFPHKHQHAKITRSVRQHWWFVVGVEFHTHLISLIRIKMHVHMYDTNI